MFARTTSVLACLVWLVPGPLSAQCAPGVVEMDRARIRVHLAEVVTELRAAPVDHLSAEARAARATNIERLEAYAARGEFPHGSPDQPGVMVPTFIDAEGRPCAMAHLVIESGHREVAEEIARDELHAYVPDIRHPALRGWLEANGMTVAEAARVQPGYICACPVDAGSYCAPAIFCPGPDPCPAVLLPCTPPMGCSYPMSWHGPPSCDDAGVCTCPYPPTPGNCGLAGPAECDDAGVCVCPSLDVDAGPDAGHGALDSGVRDADASIDGGSDASTRMDAGLDAGRGSSVTSGCSAGTRRPSMLWVIVVAALVSALRRSRA